MSENPAENMPPEPRRKRRWWLWALIVIPLVLGVAGRTAWVMLPRQAEGHLEEVKAHLSFKLIPAKDLPTLWGPPPKPEDNAAPIYAEIDKKLGAPGKQLEDLEAVWGLREPDRPKKGRPGTPPRDPVRVHEFLDQFAEVFKLCDEAARRPGYRTDFDWSDLDARPNYPRILVLARLLALRSVVAAEEGRWDEAYADVGTLGAVARHLDQEKAGLLQCMVAGVIRDRMARPLSALIQEHPPSAGQAETLRRMLTTDAKGQLRDTLVGGCIGMNETIEKILSGKAGSPAPAGFQRYYLIEDQANYLETMDRFVRAAGMPWDRARAEMEAMERSAAEGPSVFRPFSGANLMAMPKLMKKFYLSHAKSDMLLAALDLAEYRREHGKYPAALADLPNAGKLPRDPYTETGTGGPENEQPFHYRVVGEGFVLWSVGPDDKDGAEVTVEQLEKALALWVPPKAWDNGGAKP
jgi:hypothetical protein